MIDWLVQLQNDIPPTTSFLSAAEQRRLASLATDKRRREWLLGRWTAKRLLQQLIAERGGPEVPLHTLEIANAADGAPEAQGWALSLSHSGDRAACAVTDLHRARIGIDIERIEPRAPVFVHDYFTTREQQHLAAAPGWMHDTLITAIWSAKEAALKAVRLGLTVDTRCLTCLPAGTPAATWQPVEIGTTLPGMAMQGWWRVEAGYVMTLAIQENQG